MPLTISPGTLILILKIKNNSNQTYFQANLTPRKFQLLCSLFHMRELYLQQTYYLKRLCFLMLSEKKYISVHRNQKEKLLQTPTCSLHADKHHGLLLHAYITPPARYRALREEQYKLVTTHCHPSWRTWSSSQRAGNQASIIVSHAVLLQCKPALLINPGTPQLFP